MNFFEQELRKLVEQGTELEDVRFAGRVAVGRLGATTTAKLEFITEGMHGYYSAVQASIFNRSEGEIDSTSFSFKDIWGSKKVSNPNFRNGIDPHIWVSDRKTDWYAYTPTPRDFKVLADTINAYLGVFKEPELAPQIEKHAPARSDGYTSVVETIAKEKAKPKQPRKSVVNKSKNREEI
jgi:hypothetical protein